MLIKRGILDRGLTEEEQNLLDNATNGQILGSELIEKLPPSCWELIVPAMWKENAVGIYSSLANREPEQGRMQDGGELYGGIYYTVVGRGCLRKVDGTFIRRPRIL